MVNDGDEIKVKIEEDTRVELDPRQLCVRLAAVAIIQPGPTASSSSEDTAGASGTAYHTQALRRIPSGQLGPAEQPRGRGRPKGSKSRSRSHLLTFGMSAPPGRAAAAKARAVMTPLKK